MLRRSWIVLIESLGLVLALLVLLAGAWRVMQGPITFSQIIPTLQQHLSAPDGAWQTKIESALLIWDKEKNQLVFKLHQARVVDQHHQILLQLPDLTLNMNIRRALTDFVSPLEISGTGLVINMMRQEDGRFVLLKETAAEASHAAEGAAASTAAPTTAEPKAENGLWARMARQLGVLGAVHFSHARINIHNTRQQTIGQASIPHLTLASDRRGVYVDTRLEVLSGQKQGKIDVRLAWQGKRDYASFDVTLETIVLDQVAQLAGFSAPLSLTSPVSGNVRGQLSTQGDLEQIAFDLSLGAGELSWPEAYDKPIAVLAGGCHGALNITQQQGQWQACEIKTPHPVLSTTGTLAGQNNRTTVDIHVMVNDLPADQMANYWPMNLGKKPRQWLTKHMTRGNFPEMTSHVQLSGAWGQWQDWALDNITGVINLEGGTIAFNDKLPAAEGLKLAAAYTAEGFNIDLKEGRFDNIVLSPSPVVIRDLSGDLPAINITANTQTALAHIFSVLEKPPINLKDKTGFSAEGVQGTVNAQMVFDFPLLASLTVDQIIIKASGKIADVQAKGLVEGVSIDGGSAAFDLANNIFSTKGQLKVNGVMADVAWMQNFSNDARGDTQQASLQATIADWQWDKMGLPLRYYWRGPVGVSLKYAGGEKAKKLNAALDFTQTALVLDEFGWRKAAGEKAEGTAAILFDNDGGVTIETFKAQGKGMALSGHGKLLAGGRVDEFALTAAPLGPSQFALTMTRKDGVPLIEVIGDALVMPGAKLSEIAVPDVADEPERKEQKKEQAAAEAGAASASQKKPSPAKPKEPVVFDVQVGKLITTKEKFFAPFQLSAERDDQGWKNISLNTTTHTGVPFHFVMTHGAITTIQGGTPNFGAVLSAWDALNDMKGGALILEGKGVPENPRRVKGDARLSDFSIKNLPVLATLINALSITGLPEALAGEGIRFDKLKGEFELNGDEVTLTKWITSGSNIGLNLEGVVNVETKDAKMAGSIVPFNTVNRVISDIPVIGDLVAGGYGGGLLATNFTLTGKLDKLEASINPFSAFTPGIFRKIFFDEKPTLDEENQ